MVRNSYRGWSKGAIFDFCERDQTSVNRLVADAEPVQNELVGERGFEPPTPWSRRLCPASLHNWYRVGSPSIYCLSSPLPSATPTSKQATINGHRAQVWAQRIGTSFPNRKRDIWHFVVRIDDAAVFLERAKKSDLRALMGDSEGYITLSCPPY